MRLHHLLSVGDTWFYASNESLSTLIFFLWFSFPADNWHDNASIRRQPLPSLSLTYALTYSIQQSPSWEASGFQLVKKFPAFLETRRSITAYTIARHLSLFWASSIQSIPPQPTSWRSCLMLSSHLHLGLSNGLFLSRFATKTLCRPLLSPIRATCPTHLTILDFITRTVLCEEYRSLSSSFLHYPFQLIINSSIRRHISHRYW